jgi:hypothetical protein
MRQSSVSTVEVVDVTDRLGSWLMRRVCRLFSLSCCFTFVGCRLRESPLIGRDAGDGHSNFRIKVFPVAVGVLAYPSMAVGCVIEH